MPGTASDADPPPTRLRLYVAGDAPNSVSAIANVTGVLALHLAHGIELEIIDVVADPDRGLRDGILMTPMLVRLAPPPQRRILGTLADRHMLLAVLGLPIGTQ